MDALATPKLLVGESHDIPPEVIAQWREVTNLLAESMGVEAGLVMRGNPDSMEVMAASDKEVTPYEEGETAPREGRLYCETVIKTQRPLIVEDAFTDPEWRGNPDTELGLASYYGLPVNWPSGENFGTVCVLSAFARRPNKVDRNLMERLRDLIELSLALLVAKAEAEHAVQHDGLTGLLDRHIFIDAASECVENHQDSNSAPVLMVWDIADSKVINMRLGLAMADLIIQEVAERAEAALDKADFIGRLGGDEFAALFTHCDQFDANEVSDALRASVEDIQLFGDEGESSLKIHVGVAKLQSDETVGEWLERADQQKFRSKHSGLSRGELEADPWIRYD